MSSSDTVLNTTYLISLVMALVTSYMLTKNSPNLSPAITYFVVPVIVAYLFMEFINWAFPHIDTKGRNMYMYFGDWFASVATETNYVQVLPIFLFVFAFFFVVLRS